MEEIAGNSSDGIPMPPYWNLPWTVILSGTMIIFMSCAIVGNTMVLMVVFRHHGMRTRTNMFLCSLAAADLLSALICMPVSLATVIKGQWIFNDVFCQFNGFTMPLFFVASIHTLMYTSIHKYISISRPFSHILTRRRVITMIGAAWLWAFLTGYITVHGLNHVLYKPYTTQCGPEYPQNLRTYMHTMYTVSTCYMIPFIIIIVCYTLVFREIRAHTQRLEKNTNQEPHQIFLQQRRITFTLFLVLLAFILSWTPYILYSIYASIIKDKKSLPSYLNALAYWFGYMNSAVNPFIYALRSPAFREGFKEIICRGDGIIVSEETDPFDSPSALRRFRAFLRQSLSPRKSSSATWSQSVSRKESMTSVANLVLHSYRRRTSTNSLPESFKFGMLLNPHRKGARERNMGYNRQSSLVYYPTGENLCQDRDEAKEAMETSFPLEEQKPLLSNGNAIHQGNQTPTDSVDSRNLNHPNLYCGRDLENIELGLPRREESVTPGFMNYEDDNVFVVVADVAPYRGKHQSSSYEAATEQIHSNPEIVVTPYDAEPESRDASRTHPEHAGKMEQEVVQAAPAVKHPGLLRRLISWPHSRCSRTSSGAKHSAEVESRKTCKSPNATYQRSVSDDPWSSKMGRGENTDTKHDNVRKTLSDTEVSVNHKNKKSSNSMAGLNGDKEPSGKSWSLKEKLRHKSGSKNKDRNSNRLITPENRKVMRMPSIERLDQSRLRHSRSTPIRKRKRRPRSEGNALDANGVDSSPRVRRSFSHEGRAVELKVAPGSNCKESVAFQEVNCNFGSLQRSTSDPCLTFRMIQEKIQLKKCSKKGAKHVQTENIASRPSKPCANYSTKSSVPCSFKQSGHANKAVIGKGSPDSGISTSLSGEGDFSGPATNVCSDGESVKFQGKPKITGQHYGSLGSLNFTPKSGRRTHSPNPNSAMRKANSERILSHLENPFKRFSFKGFYTKGEGVDKETCV